MARQSPLCTCVVSSLALLQPIQVRQCWFGLAKWGMAACTLLNARCVCPLVQEDNYRDTLLHGFWNPHVDAESGQARKPRERKVKTETALPHRSHVTVASVGVVEVAGPPTFTFQTLGHLRLIQRLNKLITLLAFTPAVLTEYPYVINVVSTWLAGVLTTVAAWLPRESDGNAVLCKWSSFTCI